METKINIRLQNKFDGKEKATKIYLDGKKLENFSRTEANEFEVTPGEHKIHAKYYWFGSNELNCTFEENETKSIVINSSKVIDNLFQIVALLTVLHIALQYFYKIDVVKWALMCICIVATYFMTIKRKSFLTIKEL